VWVGSEKDDATPETSPECCSVTPETAESMVGTKVRPRPAQRTIIGTITPVRYPLLGVSPLSMSRPAEAVAVPVATSGRTPVRATTWLTVPVTMSMRRMPGMNAAPVLSGL
jgi:hypothetical protein